MSAAKNNLLELMKTKDALEAEIIMTQATSKPGKLVDADGFPRNDIDVHAERITRNKIATLQNDHKALMAKIEQGLYAVHGEARAQGTVTSGLPMPAGPVGGKGPLEIELSGKGKQVALSPLDAFYLCDNVAENSPANSAGLRIGDKILQFGSVLKRNTLKENLGKATQECVGHSENEPIKVVVYRNGEGMLNLTLTPRKWSGRGLLGCRFVEEF